MKITSARFEVSAPDLRSSPGWLMPEFAFIGRSNVGKSSLINSLAEHGGLAKVSDTPGKTQLLNFFVLNRSWCLVDLPGYGYAHVSQERQLGFNKSVADFLSGRPNLRCVYVLIDSRLPPQAIDMEFLRWIEGCAVPYALIFTKTDKQSASRGRANIAVFTKAMQTWRSELPDILVSSSKNGQGRTEILDHIQAALVREKQSAG